MRDRAHARMPLVRLLGALDLACAGSLTLVAGAHSLPYLQAPLALALGVKALTFPGSFASRIDLVCAIAMILLLWTPNAGIAIAIAAYLAVKGLSSMR